jgi:hypothetical protein
MLTLSIALGVALAQTTPPNPPAQETPQTNAQAAGKTAAAASTALNEMKTTTFKGVLVDMACASHTSASADATPAAGSATQPSDPAKATASDSAAGCPVSANSSELGMKLDDGKTVRFDMVGNQRAQDALKSDKRWSKYISANKPIHATVSGVLNGDKLIVASIH